MSSAKFKKGDLVIVDERGKAAKYEILSIVHSGARLKNLGELLYEARNVITGGTRTIAEEEVLRRATPVDSSAQLFEHTNTNNKGRA
jgi:hypothetical protein